MTLETSFDSRTCWGLVLHTTRTPSEKEDKPYTTNTPIYIYMRTHNCIYACIYVDTSTYVHRCVHIYICVCIYIYVHIYICICMCICIYRNVCTHTHWLYLAPKVGLIWFLRSRPTFEATSVGQVAARWRLAEAPGTVAADVKKLKQGDAVYVI